MEKAIDVAASMWDEDVREDAAAPRPSPRAEAERGLNQALYSKGARLPLTRLEVEVLRVALDHAAMDYVQIAAQVRRNSAAVEPSKLSPMIVRRIMRELCDFLVAGEPPRDPTYIARWRSYRLAEQAARDATHAAGGGR